MRCTTDHHNLAFLTSKGPGFHHASFQVGSVDEIALGATHMRDSGWQMGWGLGRARDRVELLLLHAGPLGELRGVLPRPRLHPRGVRLGAARFPEEDSLYVWGPPLPAEFVENSELRERLRLLPGEPMVASPDVFRHWRSMLPASRS